MPASPSYDDLNFVFVGNFPFPAGDAGAQLVSHRMCHFARRGSRVALMVLRGLPIRPGNEALSGEYRGIPYVVVGRRMVGMIRSLGFAAAYLKEGCGFLRARWDPGRRNVLVIYGQPDPENIGFLLAGRRMGYLALSWIVEDLSVQDEDATVRYRLKRCALMAMSRTIRSWVDGISVLTTRLQERFRRHGVPVAVIPIEREPPPMPPPAEPHRPLRILYAGSFARRDGLETLLAAFRDIRDDAGGAVLTLVGPCSSAAAARLAPCGLLDPGVRRTGYVSDAEFWTELCEADILCMTRRDTAYANAGFPYKLASYLASGRPVVATRVSDVHRYLVDRRDALLVPADSPAALAEAFRWLRDHPAEAVAIGQRGRQAFERHFTSDSTGPLWVDLIEEAARFREARDPHHASIGTGRRPSGRATSGAGCANRSNRRS